MMDESAKPLLESCPGYAEMDDFDRYMICNGCGSSKAKFDFVPDTILGLNIREACYRHDYAYWLGQTLEDKAAADLQFLNNMLTLINTQSVWILKWPRRWRAMTYYSAVCDKGHSAFWNGKPRTTSQEPPQ
jgi:hypothetical protein